MQPLSHEPRVQKGFELPPGFDDIISSCPYLSATPCNLCGLSHTVFLPKGLPVCHESFDLKLTHLQFTPPYTSALQDVESPPSIIGTRRCGQHSRLLAITQTPSQGSGNTHAQDLHGHNRPWRVRKHGQEHRSRGDSRSSRRRTVSLATQQPCAYHTHRQLTSLQSNTPTKPRRHSHRAWR